MGRTCKEICIDYKCPKIPNGQKYLFGCKRCTYCELFLSINEIVEVQTLVTINTLFIAKIVVH